LGAALQADGEYEVRAYGLKHQKEKRSMDYFAGLDVSVKETSVASALPHSEGIAYKPPRGEIAMCPRVGRMSAALHVPSK
jgi:hypothetical protein